MKCRLTIILELAGQHQNAVRGHQEKRFFAPLPDHILQMIERHRKRLVPCGDNTGLKGESLKQSYSLENRGSAINETCQRRPEDAETDTAQMKGQQARSSDRPRVFERKDNSLLLC